VAHTNMQEHHKLSMAVRSGPVTTGVKGTLCHFSHGVILALQAVPDRDGLS
jgi:hypothetical protein